MSGLASIEPKIEPGRIAVLIGVDRPRKSCEILRQRCQRERFERGMDSIVGTCGNYSASSCCARV